MLDVLFMLMIPALYLNERSMKVSHHELNEELRLLNGRYGLLRSK